MRICHFEDLLGKTITRVRYGMFAEQLYLETSDQQTYVMEHHQDCCEVVVLTETIGDWDDIIGSPLLLSEITSSDDADDPNAMWTFYKLSTIKGSITLRWHGSSNGYYSVDVNFSLSDYKFPPLIKHESPVTFTH